MVTIRSSSGMKLESTFSIVVLPLPVPPVTRMFRRASHAQADELRPSRCVSVPRPTRSSMVRRRWWNLRIVIAGPRSESGGMIAFTREPSGQPSVHHGGGLVDPAADLGDDLVEDPPQVRFVGEPGVGREDPAAALDVDLLVVVDHDLGDRVVRQEPLERAVADDLVGDLLAEQLRGRRCDSGTSSSCSAASTTPATWSPEPRLVDVRREQAACRAFRSPSRCTRFRTSANWSFASGVRPGRAGGKSFVQGHVRYSSPSPKSCFATCGRRAGGAPSPAATSART